MKDYVSKAALFALLIGLCVAARLLPHPPNFTPLASAALLAGVAFQRRFFAAMVPLAAMAISDVFVGSYDPRIMAAVYASLVFPVFLRHVLGRRLTALRIGTSAVISSAVFFMATNFAVWLFGDIYPSSAAGLLECYAAGLAFLKYTVAGDVFWSGILFGGYKLAIHGRSRVLQGALATASLGARAGLKT
jgi:hypothetical protein